MEFYEGFPNHTQVYPAVAERFLAGDEPLCERPIASGLRIAVVNACILRINTTEYTIVRAMLAVTYNIIHGQRILVKPK